MVANEGLRVVIPGHVVCGIGRHELGRPDPQEADQHQHQDDQRSELTGLDVRPAIP